MLSKAQIRPIKIIFFSGLKEEPIEKTLELMEDDGIVYSSRRAILSQHPFELWKTPYVKFEIHGHILENPHAQSGDTVYVVKGFARDWVDVHGECTGIFSSREKAEAKLKELEEECPLDEGEREIDWSIEVVEVE